MSTNRISGLTIGTSAVPRAAGFAVCNLPQAASGALALQLLAQQQAYEQALRAARQRSQDLRQQNSLN